MSPTIIEPLLECLIVYHNNDFTQSTTKELAQVYCKVWQLIAGTLLTITWFGILSLMLLLTNPRYLYNCKKSKAL